MGRFVTPGNPKCCYALLWALPESTRTYNYSRETRCNYFLFAKKELYIVRDCVGVHLSSGSGNGNANCLINPYIPSSHMMIKEEAITIANPAG
jgi:hypothetical protein